MSPELHFHPKDYLLDFSLAGIDERAWFMREMTHVWQHQKGIKVIRGWFKNRNYDYSPLEPGRAFTDYGIEQQGDIVKDYYLRTQGQNPTNGNHSIEELEAVLPFGK